MNVINILIIAQLPKSAEIQTKIKFMRPFISRNPFNNKVLSELKFHSASEINAAIERSYNAYLAYRNEPFKLKATRLIKLSELIEANIDKYAKLITVEMGKPINQSFAEVKKSADYCRYYASLGDRFLNQERIKTEAHHSYVRYEPIGPIYAIEPFNFPFWLCFKAAIPQLLLGNTIILKPSESTGLVGLALEELFREAGFDRGELQTVFASPDHLEQIISHQSVQGLTLTGSTRAGSSIGQIAAKHIKRTVLELGGSDPFCVMKEANVKLAVQLAVKSRIANCGQVCFSAKRFIVHELWYDKFKDQLVEALKQVRIGDPIEKETEMGPMARADLVENLKNQIQQGVEDGARLLYQGDVPITEGNFFGPTVVEAEPKNILASEETFGPLFTLIRASSNEEVIKLANATKYGLGGVIVSQLKEKELENQISQLDCGMVFVNEVVKSDARLPSGGIKSSGYGRECGYWGMQNFANVKTVWIA